jgi:protein-disulfide isomerase
MNIISEHKLSALLVLIIIGLIILNINKYKSVNNLEYVQNWETIFDIEVKNKNLKKKIIVFHDFLCKYCSQYYKKVELFKTKSTMYDVQYISISVLGKESEFLANLSYCSNDIDLFVSEVFNKQSFYLENDISAIKKELKYNTKLKFDSLCLEQAINDTLNERFIHYTNIADSLNINSTPTTIIDGKKIIGLIDIDLAVDNLR